MPESNDDLNRQAINRELERTMQLQREATVKAEVRKEIEGVKVPRNHEKLQAPSIGRIVHLYNSKHGNKPIAAIVVDVFNDSDTKDKVNLIGFTIYGFELEKEVFHRSRFTGNNIPERYWEWPPRI